MDLLNLPIKKTLDIAIENGIIKSSAKYNNIRCNTCIIKILLTLVHRRYRFSCGWMHSTRELGCQMPVSTAGFPSPYH